MDKARSYYRNNIPIYYSRLNVTLYVKQVYSKLLNSEQHMLVSSTSSTVHGTYLSYALQHLFRIQPTAVAMEPGLKWEDVRFSLVPTITTGTIVSLCTYHGLMLIWRGNGSAKDDLKFGRYQCVALVMWDETVKGIEVGLFNEEEPHCSILLLSGPDWNVVNLKL